MLQHPKARGEDKGDGKGDPVMGEQRESVAELAVRDVGGGFDLEDEQGHDDGEDAIAEGFEPVLAVHGVTMVFDCWRKRKRRVL